MSRILTFLKRSILMLILLLAGSSTIFAQFTPPEYNFFAAPQENSNGLPDGSDLTIVWEASNGYGQWAVTQEGKWFLLSNRLSDYNLTSPEQVSPGIVESGDLGFLPNNGSIPRDIKVTCNLVGDVRYVWPDANDQRKRFVMKGFSESGTPPIDIDFRGIPKPLSSRKVINGAIQSFGNITTAIPLTFPVEYAFVAMPTSAGNRPCWEYDWRDVFDVACDAHYLYTVDPGILEVVILRFTQTS